MHNHFATCPEFACDDADDLAAAFAPVPPRVYDVAPGFVSAFVHLSAALVTDYGFLRAVDVLHARLLLSDTLAPVYVATVDTARKAKGAAMREGVVKAPKRTTREQKVAAESRAWGLS
jgi:hypothetical protein